MMLYQKTKEVLPADEKNFCVRCPKRSTSKIANGTVDPREFVRDLQNTRSIAAPLRI